MRVRWFGQSAFLLTDAGQSVMIDPFGPAMELAAARGIRFAYPAIEGVSADLVLVTHEHFDHNGTGVVAGDPPVVRLAGTHQTPVGTVVGVASEHDPEAGIRRGPNACFRLTLGGVDVCHMGDFGQAALRPEQADALRGIDVLFVPVGGGPTLDGEGAAAVVAELAPRVVVPMHYGTPAADFLGPVDVFLEAVGREIVHADGSEAEIDAGAEPHVLVLAPPDPVDR
jgi:L-ascorbate metabolism protein UlaG (beta-lactamase superfamily)